MYSRAIALMLVLRIVTKSEVPLGVPMTSALCAT
jgi:hypothetical protein